MYPLATINACPGMKAKKTWRTNSRKRTVGPQKPDPWTASVTTWGLLNQYIIEASGARRIHRVRIVITIKLLLRIFRVDMASSFGCSHYRIFKLPKPEKRLPKCAEFRKMAER